MGWARLELHNARGAELVDVAHGQVLLEMLVKHVAVGCGVVAVLAQELLVRMRAPYVRLQAVLLYASARQQQ